VLRAGCALDVAYTRNDVSDYATWLSQLHVWLAEMLRVVHSDWGRLCLNLHLDRDSGAEDGICPACAAISSWQRSGARLTIAPLRRNCDIVPILGELSVGLSTEPFHRAGLELTIEDLERLVMNAAE
jgi:hypothetical protein